VPDLEVGHGPRSKPHVILRRRPPRPGRPYSAPAETACGRVLSGLVDNRWADAADIADDGHICDGCRDYARLRMVLRG
jgi:hypothetical protein